MPGARLQLPFDLCRRQLGFSKAKAFRRTCAARLVNRFPVIAEHLRDGRLTVTTLVLLRDLLDAERLDEILGRAAGRTEEQVEELVAALKPQPAPLDLFRRLPAAGTPTAAAEEVTVTGTGPELAPASERAAGTIKPISEELRVLRITVGKACAEKLERARAAFGGSLEQIIEHCLGVALTRYERRRRGVGRAQRGESRAQGRYVPAAVRDAVWRRDEGRCAHVGPTGVRCGETRKLELHHILSYARGGKATVDNLTLRCGAHNRFHAERELGKERVAQAISRARRRG